MNSTPEQQWSALSALYEKADGMPAHELAAWLARLDANGHPLLPQLRRMLEARAHLQTNDFLMSLPKLMPADAAQAGTWSPGRRVGPYRLVRPLGEGGMAEVWLADRDDGILKRQAAIKLPYPRPGRESFALRFERERNILASLRHPHIAALFDAGVTDDGQAWLALEYVQGQPISQFCDERRLGLRERVTLFRQVLLAVQHAHANLVIHRDLKPANVLVTPRGEVRLLDFGIAKLLEAEGDAIAETELTRQAGRSMTPRYASPEQLTGQPLTTACDVYSLGVVFYELICGEGPYDLKASTAAQLEQAILELDPRPPSRRSLTQASALARGTTLKALRRALSPELDAIALRCLAKSPRGRYSSVDALLADVDRWLAGDAVLARAPSAWFRFVKFAARHRIAVAAATAAIVTLAAVAAVAVVLGMQAREDSARAMAARDFMLSLFKRADQEKSRGAEITARELLDSGRKDVLSRLVGQPALQAELLQGIADIQRDMGEYADADDTYSEVVRIYERLSRPRELALARIANAEAVLLAGDAQRAQRLLQEVKVSAQRLRGDAEIDAQLDQVDGSIAISRGDAAHARDLFARSWREAADAFGSHHLKTIDALRGLIFAEQRLGHFDAALALYGTLETVAAKADIPRADLAAMDWDRADLLYSAGRYAQALAHDDAALPRCVAALGADHEACRRLRLNRVRTLLRLGWTQRTQADAPFVAAMMQERSSPSLRVEAAQVLLQMQVLGQTAVQAGAAFDTVLGIARSGPELGIQPVRKIRALLVLAHSRLLSGDASGAQRWAHEALDALAGVADETVLTRTVRGEAAGWIGIALIQQGDPGAAAEWIERSRRELAEVVGAQHPQTHLMSLNGALALEALGRRQDALAITTAALPILQRAMGVDSPAYQRAVRFSQRLRSSAGDGGSRNSRLRNDKPQEFFA